MDLLLTSHSEERQRSSAFFRQVVGLNKQLDSRLHFLLELLISSDGEVELSEGEIDDHTGDLGRVLSCYEVGHVAEDVGADHLLLLCFSGSPKLLTHEDGHDFGLVALCFAAALVRSGGRRCRHLVRVWHRHPLLLLLVAMVVVLTHDLARILHLRLLGTWSSLLVVVATVVVVDRTAVRHAHCRVLLVHHPLRLLVLHLAHQQRKRSDQLNHVLVVALHLACFLPVELLSVPLLFFALLARLFRLTVVTLELAVLEYQFRLLFCHASCISFGEAHEA